MSHPVFYANLVGAKLVVVRRDDFPDAKHPDDVLGPGTHTIHASDSERARSALAARLTDGG